jgi:hypothetical protein
MVTDTGCPLVAILDSAGFPADCYTSFLSAAELSDASAIANDRRRQEWVAGRVAAKYVFLHRDRCCASAASTAMHSRHLTNTELAIFAPETYRSVDVIKDKSPGGGPAGAGWHAEGTTVKVAISHARGLACAFIGTEKVYSLDLEAASPRIPAFYLQNFTAAERDWASTSSRLLNVDSDWLYTLLWSAKECLLKTPRFAGLSLWNMPSLEIDFLGGSEHLAKVYASGSLPGIFHLLRAEVSSPEFQQGPRCRTPFQLAVSGTAELILTALTRLDQDHT